MPRAAHAVAPFTDTTPVMIREVFPMLYEKLLQSERRVIGGGEMVLGSPGVGIRTFGDYVIKRSEPPVTPLQSPAASHDGGGMLDADGYAHGFGL